MVILRLDFSGISLIGGILSSVAAFEVVSSDVLDLALLNTLRVFSCLNCSSGSGSI